MFFPIEIGTYLYILRLWWYDNNYIIRILVSGMLVASKWPIFFLSQQNKIFLVLVLRSLRGCPNLNQLKEKKKNQNSS